MINIYYQFINMAPRLQPYIYIFKMKSYQYQLYQYKSSLELWIVRSWKIHYVSHSDNIIRWIGYICCR